MYSTYSRLGLHVTATPREVIAKALERLIKGARKGRKHRTARHAFLREMLSHHRKALGLFREFRF